MRRHFTFSFGRYDRFSTKKRSSWVYWTCKYTYNLSLNDLYQTAILDRGTLYRSIYIDIVCVVLYYSSDQLLNFNPIVIEIKWHFKHRVLLYNNCNAKRAQFTCGVRCTFLLLNTIHSTNNSSIKIILLSILNYEYMIHTAERRGGNRNRRKQRWK